MHKKIVQCLMNCIFFIYVFNIYELQALWNLGSSNQNNTQNIFDTPSPNKDQNSSTDTDTHNYLAFFMTQLKESIQTLGLSNDQAQGVLEAFSDLKATSDCTFDSLSIIIQSIKDFQKEVLAASLTDNILVTLFFETLIQSQEQKGVMLSVNGAQELTTCLYAYSGPALTSALYQNVIIFYKAAVAAAFTTTQIKYMVSTFFFKYTGLEKSIFSKQQEKIITIINNLITFNQDADLINVFFSILISDPDSSLYIIPKADMQNIVSIYKIASTAQLSPFQIQQVITAILQSKEYDVTILPQQVTSLATLKSAAINAGLTDNQLITLWLISTALIVLPTITTLTPSGAQNIVAVYKAAVTSNITPNDMQTLVDALYQTLLIEIPRKNLAISNIVYTAQEVTDIIAIYQALVSSNRVNSSVAADMITQYITLTVAQNVASATAKAKVLKQIS